MPHDMEWELAEEICARYPVEMVRFGSSGTEVTMHACRIARAATNRDKIMKFEGSYHGLHDTALVSVKPQETEEYGDPNAPNSVAGRRWGAQSRHRQCVIASFNNLHSVENRFKQYPGQIAAIILEPILMNVGLVHAAAGLSRRPARLCDENRRVADFRRSENRRETGVGRRQRLFRREARHDLPGEIDRRRIAARRVWREPHSDGPDLAAQSFSRRHLQHQSRRHGGGLATFREVLTRENYEHVGKLSKKLTEGYRKIVAKVGLQAYVASAGVNGALMLYPQEIQNYRDWTAIDVDLWRHYWFAMVNRGVLAQPYWWDEQWTISVQHTEADIDKHLAVFEEIAPGLAKAQQERGVAFVGAQGTDEFVQRRAPVG